MMATVWLLSAGVVMAAKLPKPTDKYYKHAIELIAKGDHEGGIIELKTALRADPTDVAARVLLGNTYLEIDDGVSAAQEFLRARKDGAGDSFVTAPLGRAYVLQGRYEEALKELSKAGNNQSTAAEVADDSAEGCSTGLGEGAVGLGAETSDTPGAGGNLG